MAGELPSSVTRRVSFVTEAGPSGLFRAISDGAIAEARREADQEAGQHQRRNDLDERAEQRIAASGVVEGPEGADNPDEAYPCSGHQVEKKHETRPDPSLTPKRPTRGSRQPPERDEENGEDAGQKNEKDVYTPGAPFRWSEPNSRAPGRDRRSRFACLPRPSSRAGLLSGVSADGSENPRVRRYGSASVVVTIAERFPTLSIALAAK